MRRMTKREIDRRWPPIKRCNCGQSASAEQTNFVAAAVAYAPPQQRAALPANGYRIVGKLIETETTPNRIEDMGAFRSISCVRPRRARDGYCCDPYDCWKVHDSSADKTTVWCRDLMLIVEPLP
jgi:hypothetical protein